MEDHDEAPDDLNLTVVITPEPQAASTYWVHTVGLSEINKPELEMRYVAPLFLTESVNVVRTLTKAVQQLDKEDLNFKLVIDGIVCKMAPSEDSSWDSKGKECLCITSLHHPSSVPNEDDVIH